MSDLRFAIFGAGFWARYQMAAWNELSRARCVAVYNRTRATGEAFARDFAIPAVYDDPEELLKLERLDFVDIVTHPSSLSGLVKTVASHRVPVISQKPMAPSLEVARANIGACRDAGVPYLIHENWRWQNQLRELKRVLNEGAIGPPFRARITMVSAYDVYINEPQIKDLEEFILTDMGTHILDLVRFLFGEAETLYCQTQRVHTDCRGEDVATVMMAMRSGATVTCEIGYPGNPVESDYFPQTLVFIEGPDGTIELARDYCLRVTTSSGTHSERYPPIPYKWVDPDYHAVHSSIVACNANFLSALRGQGAAETTAEDNLKTLELVFAAYESSRQGKVIQIAHPCS